MSPSRRFSFLNMQVASPTLHPSRDHYLTEKVKISKKSNGNWLKNIQRSSSTSKVDTSRIFQPINHLSEVGKQTRWTQALGTKLGHRDMLIHQQVAKRDPVGKFEQIDPKQSKII